MPITWSDAVTDADNADDERLRQRMMDQVAELRPLIESFISEFRRNGVASFWTGGGAGSDRSVWFTQYGNWGIDVRLDRRDDMPSRLVWFGPGPQEGVRLVAKSDPRFYEHVAAMEQTKDWVPRSLVEAMRAMNIPIPR